MIISLIFTVTGVYAIELGGFDVDIGTGNSEDDSGWDREENTGEITSPDDVYDSSESWNDTDSSWNTGEDSSGAGDYVTENTTQTENDRGDSYLADSYGVQSSDNSEQNNISETIREEEQQNNSSIFRENQIDGQQNPEGQISDISPTPEPSPSAALTAVPTFIPSPTPKAEIQKNILTVPQKEEELPEQECLTKMQIIYCQKKFKMHPQQK